MNKMLLIHYIKTLLIKNRKVSFTDIICQKREVLLTGYLVGFVGLLLMSES